uniref:Uncharacterized protein n=1 Tax=uncultured prokaryote TaxID=198431 RepID=A0A0H5Q575_9ZZZZ|nr:hypothetical protein [uncultured prokaryote]
MRCVNVSLFGARFVLRLVGSETSTPTCSVNSVSVRLNASGFGDLVIVEDGICHAIMIAWRKEG